MVPAHVHSEEVVVPKKKLHKGEGYFVNSKVRRHHILRVGLFNLGCYLWLHKFRHASPISGREALPGRGLLSLLHNGTCEAKDSNLN